MKKDKEKKHGKDPVRPAKSPKAQPAKDHSNSSADQNEDQGSAESPNGKIKRKESANADRELAPKEEL